MPKPCSCVTSVPSAVTPSEPAALSGVSALSKPEPAAAPAHWAITYKTARAALTRPVASMPAVTAGLICPPEMCPIACRSYLCYYFSCFTRGDRNPISCWGVAVAVAEEIMDSLLFLLLTDSIKKNSEEKKRNDLSSWRVWKELKSNNWVQKWSQNNRILTY